MSPEVCRAPATIKTVVTLLLGVACTHLKALLPSGSKTAANRSLQQKSEIQSLAQSAERNALGRDSRLPEGHRARS